MRIVSLNAWGGAMFDALAAWLPTVEADVVCIQEVTSTAGLSGWTTFVDGERELPQRASLFDDVAALLPDHQGAFVTCDSGPVTAPDATVHRQEFGMAVYVRVGLAVIGQLSRFVHGSYVHHDRWAIDGRPRTAQGVRVVDARSRRTVSVVQAHGLRDPAGKHDTPSRAAQAVALARVVTDLRHDGDVSVLCGDLNLLPDSATFAALAEVGLRDLVGHADTRGSRYTKPVRHADYCLVSDPDAVAAFTIVTEPEVSDHRPVLLDLFGV